MRYSVQCISMCSKNPFVKVMKGCSDVEMPVVEPQLTLKLRRCELLELRTMGMSLNAVFKNVRFSLSQWNTLSKEDFLPFFTN